MNIMFKDYWFFVVFSSNLIIIQDKVQPIFQQLILSNQIINLIENAKIQIKYNEKETLTK